MPENTFIFDDDDIPEPEKVNTGGGAYIGGDFITDEGTNGKVLIQGNGNIASTNTENKSYASQKPQENKNADKSSPVRVITIILLLAIIFLCLLALIVVIFTPGFIFDDLCLGVIILFAIVWFIKELIVDLGNTSSTSQ
jgi:hypothetical protein